MEFSTTVLINATPAEVWATLTTPSEMSSGWAAMNSSLK
jgi:uncharacterized protein YndB with AHSA1/START domain